MNEELEFVTAKCPATVGNVGPGFDAVGLCLGSAYDYVSVALTKESTSKVLDVNGRDAERVPIDPTMNCAVIAAEKVLELKNRSEKVALKIQRELPISGGLGSSAAASVGGALAAAALIGAYNETDLILRAALAGESSVAGEHLDNIAPCLLGGMTIVLKNEPPLVQKFELDESFWTFVIATPNSKLDTKKARSVLPDTVKIQEWPTYLAHSSATVLNLSLNDPDNLRQSFHDHFATPHRRKLLEEYDRIEGLARSFHSCGFAISGAGPSMIAIFDDPSRAQKYTDTLLVDPKIDSVINSPINNLGASVIEGGL